MTEQELQEKLTAAENGDSNAMNEIGVHYYQLEDYSQAKEWFLKAAELDNIYAIGNLGMLYQQGLGVEKDLNKAFECYQNAACRDFGLQWAANQLNSMGINYQNGANGFPQDDSLTCKCYKAAAEGKDPNGMSNYGYCLQCGKGAEVNLWGAFQWYQKSASYNNIYGLANVAYCYENGIGTTIDFEEACHNYLKAIRKGNNADWVKDGLERTREKMVDKCLEILQNDEKILEEGETFYSFEKSTKIIAQLKRARCYELGIGGVERNLETAIACFWPCAFDSIEADKGFTELKVKKIENLKKLQKRELYAPEFAKAEAGDVAWQCNVAEAYIFGRWYRSLDDTKDEDFYRDENEAKKWVERALHEAKGDNCIKWALSTYIEFVSAYHDKFNNLDECINELFEKFGECVYLTKCIKFKNAEEKFMIPSSWIVYYNDRCEYTKVLRAANAAEKADALWEFEDENDEFVIVSDCYRYGRGTAIDLEKALHWLKNWQSKIGPRYKWNPEPYDRCAAMISKLEDDIKNFAIDSTRQKAENGDAQAACQIGLWYQNGENGYEQNWDLAKSWFQKAAANGSHPALSFYQEICKQEAETKSFMEGIIGKLQKQTEELELEMAQKRESQRLREENQERESTVLVKFEWEFAEQAHHFVKHVEMDKYEYQSLLNGGYYAIESYVRTNFCSDRFDINKTLSIVTMKKC